MEKIHESLRHASPLDYSNGIDNKKNSNIHSGRGVIGKQAHTIALSLPLPRSLPRPFFQDREEKQALVFEDILNHLFSTLPCLFTSSLSYHFLKYQPLPSTGLLATSDNLLCWSRYSRQTIATQQHIFIYNGRSTKRIQILKADQGRVQRAQTPPS